MKNFKNYLLLKKDYSIYSIYFFQLPIIVVRRQSMVAASLNVHSDEVQTPFIMRFEQQVCDLASTVWVRLSRAMSDYTADDVVKGIWIGF